MTVANDTSNGSSGPGAAGGATLSATNVTISGNSSPVHGGLVNKVTTNLQGSVLSNNGADCAGTKGTAIATKPITSNGYNLADDATCALGSATDLNSTNANLVALAANGGPALGATGSTSPMLTMALPAGSPAVDLFPTAVCTTALNAAGVAPATDERGTARPQGAACDSGAFELVAAPVVVVGGPGGGSGGGGGVPVAAPPTTQVNGLTVTVNPPTAAATATYTISFSPSVGLPAGSSITVTAPNSTNLLGAMSNYSIGANNGRGATVGNVAVSQAGGSSTNNQLVLTLPSSSITAGDTVTLSMQGATNPPAGSYTLTLTTSADTLPATSNIYTIVPLVSAPAGIGVPVGLGWNLLGLPAGTLLNNTLGPLYTYQAGDSSYEVIPASATTKPMWGYWVYFTTATTIIAPQTQPQTIAVPLPASHFVMVGNPNSVPVRLSGADVVYVYNSSLFPTQGYSIATTLGVGQGGVAFSFTGGTLTLTPSP